MTPRAKLPVLVLGALVLQTTVLLRVDVAGIIPDVMLLVAVTAGIAGGPERGAVVGFGAGMAIDLFLQTPLGLSALVFSIVGYGTGVLTEGTVRAAWWIPVITAMIGSAIGVVVFALVGAVVGRAHLLEPRVALIAGVVALLNGVLTPLTLRATNWALAGGAARVAARTR